MPKKTAEIRYGKKAAKKKMPTEATRLDRLAKNYDKFKPKKQSKIFSGTDTVKNYRIAKGKAG